MADERVAAVAKRWAVRKMIRATGAAYGGKVASLQTLCVVEADRGLRPSRTALPPANAQRAFQARRGDGFQPEVSGGYWEAAA